MIINHFCSNVQDFAVNVNIIVVNATCVVKKYPLNQGELLLTVFFLNFVF